MSQASPNYRKVLNQARQLPLRDQHQLAEALLRSANRDEQISLVPMRQLPWDTQIRLQDLMERNNEGQLSSRERNELKTLVARYNAVLFFNTETLLRANCPELFTPSGRLNQRQLKRSLRQRAGNSKKSSSSV